MKLQLLISFSNANYKNAYHTLVTNSEPIIDIKLVNHPVSVSAIKPFPEQAGAECIFLGRTRSDTHPDHGNLVRLEYEIYTTMAVQQLQDLAQQAINQFDCLAVRIHHSLGTVQIGEASVLVQVVCDHRDSSFKACRFLIDQLKQVVPIWKREMWADGYTWSESANKVKKDSS